MTTMTDKLIAKALEYEQKAAHLRFAAAEMNGDAVNGKQQTAGLTLDAAIALRKAQRGRQKGHHSHPHVGNGSATATTEQREATIRAFLQAADGPQTTRAIQDQLEQAGQGCSTSWTLKVMREMKDIHKHGHGAKSAWALGKAPTKKRGPTTREEQLAKREMIANVLDKYDATEPREPKRIAKIFGLTVAQSGLAPLVHQGYLKKKRDGYVRTTKPYVIEKAATPA